MIDVRKVSKIYGKKDNTFHALTNVSLSIKAGEAMAIVGKSGSGKSTLIHILTGLDVPSTGDVKSGGQSIFLGDTDTWRGQNIGIVFQQFFLQNNDTVLQNVALPLKIQGVAKKPREQAAREALTHVGLADKIKSKANNLSGGQKQRVAIARAIVGKPQVLVADEPTGNLDSENGEAIVKLLFELNKTNQTTLLMVTHDEELAERCDRIVRLKDGKIFSISAGEKAAKRSAK
ncbi:MAG: ABC transporter ATP-binding protein [Patescibacteria group bacterium]